MKKRHILLLVFVLVSCARIAVAQAVVTPMATRKVQFFPLSDVRITGGEFKHIQDLDHQYLLTLEPDRLCSWFRREAGLTPKAPPYPGWESDQGYIIPGHILGFYLSSMAMMYETTGDKAIIDRLNYILSELDQCQNAAGDGYLAAVANGRQAYAKVLTGNYKVDLGTFAGYNEPTYIMNKITLGLYGVYTKCKLALAKKVLVRMSDWFGESVVDKLDEAGLQKLLICEHGSLSESFIDTYEITGEKKYLTWAKRLNDLRMLIPASEERDILPGWHGNCQIQKFPGFEAVWRYTGEKKYLNASLFFWKTVVNNYSWVIGGNSTGEHFFPKQETDLKVVQNGGPEACNTVNMLRLTEVLYEDYASPAMVDYYERALINHILGAYEPEQGMIAYMTKLQPGGFKTHSSPYDSFWCCTGTGFESPAKFQKMIYAHDERSLYINLFIPSELHWKEKGVKLQQLTRIPDEEQTVLKLDMNAPKEFSLKIRHPYWVETGKMNVLINGKVQRITSSSSEYAEIKRLWKTGDEIVVQLPMKLRIEPLSPAQKFMSVSYGPVVLATEYPSADLKHSDYWSQTDNPGHRTSVIHTPPLENVPWLVGSDREILSKLKKVSSSPLVFQADQVGRLGSYNLIPFNRIHYSRYVLYFPHSQTATEVTNRILAKNELEQSTIDSVRIAYDLSEKEHGMEALSSKTGTELGTTWRESTNGSYFMYKLKSSPAERQALYLMLSNDNGAERTVDVFIDGHLLKTITQPKVDEHVAKQLYTEIMPIPEEFTKGKSNITVKFQARVDNTTGKIFGLRLLHGIQSTNASK